LIYNGIGSTRAGVLGGHPDEKMLPVVGSISDIFSRSDGFP